MKSFKILLFAFLLTFPYIAISNGPGNENKAVQQITLNNGLTVILDENHAQPEIFGLVIVKAGGKNDPSDATGMAHYQEHMLFKGTTELGTINWEKEKPHIDKIFELYDSLGKTRDEDKRTEIQKLINEESLKASDYAIPNELSNLLNEIGSTQINAGTGPDYTVFYNKFPSSQIERWIDLYAHRFTSPVFRSFQAELEVVYEEKNLYNDQFQTKLLEEFQKNFFKNHPYGQQTLIGSIEDLKNPSLTKMYDFFKTYYVPNNMALVISGDFKSEEILPMIEAKFGKWEKKELPQTKTWEEKPFNGREFHKVKLTPIKVALFGFRSPSNKDENALTAEITAKLLNNSYSTGLLDKLSIDGKIMIAESMLMPYLDHGAIMIFAVPKIIGQGLDDAEKLVLNEIEKLKKGEFDDNMLDAVKQEMYRRHITNMENIQNRALFLSQAFIKGQSIDDALNYPERIKKITKEDVVAMANQVFGSNYLALYSKMGFPKKEKIQKPNYKPLLANTNAKSEYANHFADIPSQSLRLKTIDFNKDVESIDIKNGHKLLRVENPLNDVFSLAINFKVGENSIPMLKYASQGISMSGAENFDVNQLKTEFAKIGTSYNVWTDDNNITIEVQGIERNLSRTLELIGILIKDPKLEQSKIKTIVDGEMTNRKMECSEPDNVAEALLEYGLYNGKSTYLDRLSKKELKKLQASELTNAFKQATEYNAQIRFSGKTSAMEVANLVKKYIPLAETPKKDDSPLDKLATNYTENTILFVNKAKARQSKVYLFINGEPFKPEDAANIDAFNDYFGGGFSGLILQEIREYRSLAYSAGGRFRTPNTNGSPSNFVGYVGTQADKTLTALETFNDLIRKMPEKTERLDMIRNHLELSAQTGRPSFRYLARSIENWKMQGYESDPVMFKLPQYKSITWDNINSFYKNRMQNKPVVYMIVGDKKQINMKELSKYGKIIEVKENVLFKK
ncbi:MAG: M16 family metallopeptidase [Bacteroidales bacterium]